MLDEMRSSVENTVSIKRKKLEIFAHHCSSNHKKVEEEIRSQVTLMIKIIESCIRVQNISYTKNPYFNVL